MGATVVRHLRAACGQGPGEAAATKRRTKGQAFPGVRVGMAAKKTKKPKTEPISLPETVTEAAVPEALVAAAPETPKPDVAPAPQLLKIELVNNAMLAAPVYEKHARGTNWLAVIDVNGTLPGGLSRQWMPKGRGDCKYIVDQLQLFDPIEFGADYSTAAGYKYRDRWYGVVVGKTDDCLMLEPAKTGAKAVLRAKLAKGQLGDMVRALEFEKQSHLEQAARIDEKIALLLQEAAGIVPVAPSIGVAGVSCTGNEVPSHV